MVIKNEFIKVETGYSRERTTEYRRKLSEGRKGFGSYKYKTRVFYKVLLQHKRGEVGTLVGKEIFRDKENDFLLEFKYEIRKSNDNPVVTKCHRKSPVPILYIYTFNLDSYIYIFV